MTSQATSLLIDGPLTVEHHQDLARAGVRATPIRKAARVATFNAWATGIIAALSAPFALFSLTGLLMTLGLALVAFNEFRGRRRLLKFEPLAASALGWNQLGFLAMIVVYCVWTMHASLSGENPLIAAFAANPELRAAGIELSDSSVELFRLCVVAFYGAVIGLSAIFQGGNALYYFTRRKYVARYVAETPKWIRDIHRATELA